MYLIINIKYNMNHNMILQFSDDGSKEQMFHKYKSPIKHKHNHKRRKRLLMLYPYTLLCFIVIVLVIIAHIKSTKTKQLIKRNNELNNMLTTVNTNKMNSENNYNDKVKEIEKVDLRIQMKQFLIEQMKKKNRTINTAERRSNSNNDDIKELKNKISELTETYQQEKLKDKDYLIKIKDINIIIENRHSKCNKLREDITNKRKQLGLNEY